MTVPYDLMIGYRRFREERFAGQAEQYRSLAQAQTPRTMVIGCADSRVDPATIFSAAPGELFIVRNIAALVPPFEETGTYHGTSAAIEFAVTSLNIENIVVLGHGMCGGIAAALAVAEQRPVGRFVEPWVELIAESRDKLLQRTSSDDPEGRQKELERLAIQVSLQNLTTFPFVKNALETGRLALHGAWFSIVDAELRWLDWDTGVFERIDCRSNDPG